MVENDFAAPIMPTGSGVADLEIAREQDALADDGELGGAVANEADGAAEQITPPEQPLTDDAAGPQSNAAAEGEAHPS